MGQNGGLPKFINFSSLGSGINDIGCDHDSSKVPPFGALFAYSAMHDKEQNINENFLIMNKNILRNFVKKSIMVSEWNLYRITTPQIDSSLMWTVNCSSIQSAECKFLDLEIIDVGLLQLKNRLKLSYNTFILGKCLIKFNSV